MLIVNYEVLMAGTDLILQVVIGENLRLAIP